MIISPIIAPPGDILLKLQAIDRNAINRIEFYADVIAEREAKQLRVRTDGDPFNPLDLVRMGCAHVFNFLVDREVKSHYLPYTPILPVPDLMGANTSLHEPALIISSAMGVAIRDYLIRDPDARRRAGVTSDDWRRLNDFIAVNHEYRQPAPAPAI